MNDLLKALLEKIPQKVLLFFLYATLVSGVLFFSLRSYEIKTGSSTEIDTTLTGITGVCIDDGIEECSKFSSPKKIRFSVTDIQFRKDEKMIKIVVDH